MRRFSSAVFLAMAMCVSGVGQSFASNSTQLKESPDTPGFQPKDGIVPDAKTAIAIAVAVGNPVYGEEQIAAEMPFIATLKEGRWTVVGSLPKGAIGGVATAVISKKDGRVEKIYHTK